MIFVMTYHKELTTEYNFSPELKFVPMLQDTIICRIVISSGRDAPNNIIYENVKCQFDG